VNKPDEEESFLKQLFLVIEKDRMCEFHELLSGNGIPDVSNKVITQDNDVLVRLVVLKSSLNEIEGLLSEKFFIKKFLKDNESTLPRTHKLNTNFCNNEHRINVESDVSLERIEGIETPDDDTTSDQKESHNHSESTNMYKVNSINSNGAKKNNNRIFSTESLASKYSHFSQDESIYDYSADSSVSEFTNLNEFKEHQLRNYENFLRTLKFETALLLIKVNYSIVYVESVLAYGLPPFVYMISKDPVGEIEK